MDIGYIGFGLVDNGVLIFGALLGFSFEDIINNRLDRFGFETRTKGLSGTLLGGGIGNAISDFLGGLCVSLGVATATFLGCMLVVIVCLPLIFKTKGLQNG